MKKTFRIEFECIVELTPQEIWPDGVPQNPQTKDVAKRLKEAAYGRGSNLIRDWNLEDSLVIWVTDTTTGELTNVH